MDDILDTLSDLVKVKVGQCSSSKELWDKLHNLYSKKSLISTTKPEHVHQDKEDIEIEQEELEKDKDDYEEGEVDIE
jgi:hypothetical protein